MSSFQPVIEQLLVLPTAADRQQFLRQQTAILSDATYADTLILELKKQADHFLRTDLEQAWQVVYTMMDVSVITQNPLHQALHLRAQGNILMIAESQCEEAIQLYDQATAIYQAHQRPVEAAQSQIGIVGSLYLLGQYQNALDVGHKILHTLEAHQQWPALTGLLLNLANIHHRLGEGQQALSLLNQAHAICIQSGADEELPGIEINRANVLHDLGQLQASLRASQTAESLFAARQQSIGVARARSSQAITNFVLGRYNQSLELFEQVRSVYLADGRTGDAVLVEQFISDLLLQVGRFQEVLQKSKQVRTLYAYYGITHEVAHAVLNEAIAYTGLRQYEQALASLAEARSLFATSENTIGVATIDLETAAVFGWQQKFEESLQTAVACGHIFASHHLPIQVARAYLVAARAAIGLACYERAYEYATQTIVISQQQQIPWLTYQGHHLLGTIAHHRQEWQTAIQEYEQAIQQLEQLRGRLMVEFRADFLIDKEQVYQDIVALYLSLAQPEPALQYVERTKSRALVDLLAHRLDLRIHPRSPADKQLVTTLQQLRQRRTQLMRRWQSSQQPDALTDVRPRLEALQEQIAQLWYKLLVRNADYARDAALSNVRAEPIQPYLDEETILLEYFVVQGELIAFLVTAQEVTAQPLPGVLRKLVRPSRFLSVNLKAVSAGGASPRLLQGAKKQLQQLHQLLIAPIQEKLKGYAKVKIVPHTAVLHYLPFHALYDGRHFLSEQYQLSYLPSASLLHYQSGQPQRVTMAAGVAFGYSYNGRLPFAVQEATTVAQVFNGRVFIEEAATIAQLHQVCQQATVLHLSTHGDFNQANPLFSGLTLADGQLNTLDIFHLRLQASLVTLSACQTGRSVVSGGDELLGLMRAFLYAGASSLILSLWRVSDESTKVFMIHFYEQLAAGKSKGEALRQAHLQFIHREAAFAHPYYWAPFFLVGDDG